jgi:hypothetical protein
MIVEAHGIKAGGHFDQEEPVSPVGVNGDLMKLFEHQGVPAVDDIYFHGRSNPGYKIVSSAAFNYDKPVVFAETYAAYGALSEKTVYKVAMDQYAMGVNLQVTSGGPALWNSAYMPQFNNYLGRMSYLLQHGRHVADVAVLYPIASLQTAYKFDGGQHPAPAPDSAPKVNGEVSAREGGIVPPEIDYQNMGEALFRARRLHLPAPEVLAERCTVEEKKLILNNQENREEFSVLIVPGGDTLTVAAAAKIRDFYDKGGVVITPANSLPGRRSSGVTGKSRWSPTCSVSHRGFGNRAQAGWSRSISKRNGAGGHRISCLNRSPVVQWHWVVPVRDEHSGSMPLEKGPRQMAPSPTSTGEV